MMARIAKFLKERRPAPEEKPKRSAPFEILLICFLAATGFVVIGAASFLAADLGHNGEIVDVPKPHHVPQYRDGLSFRFAMVHDVIHERFARHGQQHYLERNRLTQEALDALAEDDPARWPLCDDLGAGLDRVGRSAEAVDVIREKLEQQLQQDVSGRELYTSYANLGTFLIHASFRDAFAGDSVAIARFQEGVDFVQSSVRVNPEAHFGRERWQAAIAEFLLAAIKSPELLTEFDCLGNRLNRPYSELQAPFVDDGSDAPYGNAVKIGYHRFLTEIEHRLPNFIHEDGAAANPDLWNDAKELREWITVVGAEGEWTGVDVPSHREPVPFDEPMLGIIGMWRQGGGANPHFSLAIAETMLRVGQRFIAWKAYERTKIMAEQYSPNPGLQEFLKRHCERRQQKIEADLRKDTDFDEVLTQFESELDFGMQFQSDYQTYEEARLAAGIPATAADFYTKFFENRPPIASASGTEEWYRYQLKTDISAPQSALTGAIFGAGLFGLIPLLFRLLATGFQRLFIRIRSRFLKVNELGQ